MRIVDYSDNEPEEWNQFVEDDAHYTEVLRQMARICLERDVMDEARERNLI